jgi:hypothetical protein
VPWGDVLELMETLPKPAMRSSDGSLVAERLLNVVKRQASLQ